VFRLKAGLRTRCPLFLHSTTVEENALACPGRTVHNTSSAMKLLVRRTALVALVWLTAASTLLAGLPRFECVCPGRQRQSAPPDANGTGCCCGSCCVGEPGEHDGHRDCCQGGGSDSESSKPAPREDDSGKAPPGSQVHQTGTAELTQSSCARELILADGFSAAVTQTKASPILELLASVPLDVGSTSSPCAASVLVPWLTSHVPPPTDLIVTLQHFVI